MNVVFLCLDDEYAGLMQHPVYNQLPECISGIVVSTTYYGKKGFLQTAWTIFRQSGFRYFLKMAQLKLLKSKAEGETLSPLQLAHKHNVPVVVTEDVNDESTIEQIRALAPEIIIATNFNQVVGKTIRKLPTLGTFNMHKALLPKHRGMAPSFYAMLEEDKYTGVSLHWMQRRIDRGNIVAQTKIPIQSTDTVSSLNLKAAKLGGKLITQFLAHVCKDDVVPEGIIQDEFLASEHSFPNKKQVSSFLKKGLRFF